MSTFETQYLGVMKNILDTGIMVPNRTGKDALTTWGQSMTIPLDEGFPIVTTRKTTLRIAAEEQWSFLRGETDTKKLEAKNINIWKGNTTREFLDSRGLTYLPEGHLGKGYGFQWRNFGGDYVKNTETWSDEAGGSRTFFKNYDYTKNDGEGVDQLVNLIEGMQKDPTGRRHIIIGWNPQQLHEMALPPCHMYQQYQISEGKLNSSFMMRSWDFLYGAPFNIMGYALLNHAIAKLLKLEPGKLFAVGMDVHLYEDQIEIARDQITREPFKLPTLTIAKNLDTLDDLLNLEAQDFILEGYEAHPDYKNKPKMAV